MKKLRKSGTIIRVRTKCYNNNNIVNLILAGSNSEMEDSIFRVQKDRCRLTGNGEDSRFHTQTKVHELNKKSDGSRPGVRKNRAVRVKMKTRRVNICGMACIRGDILFPGQFI